VSGAAATAAATRPTATAFATSSCSNVIRCTSERERVLKRRVFAVDISSIFRCRRVLRVLLARKKNKIYINKNPPQVTAATANT